MAIQLNQVSWGLKKALKHSTLVVIWPRQQLILFTTTSTQQEYIIFCPLLQTCNNKYEKNELKYSTS